MKEVKNMDRIVVIGSCEGGYRIAEFVEQESSVEMAYIERVGGSSECNTFLKEKYEDIEEMLCGGKIIFVSTSQENEAKAKHVFQDAHLISTPIRIFSGKGSAKDRIEGQKDWILKNIKLNSTETKGNKYYSSFVGDVFNCLSANDVDGNCKTETADFLACVAMYFKIDGIKKMI